MKFVLKTAVIIVVFLLLVSSIYVVLYTDFKEAESTDDMDDHTDNETDDDTEDENGDEENDEDEEDDSVIEHTVFIEEGTATWCEPCVGVAEKLHELYEEGKHRFYYISMVYDVNEKAERRLDDDYNVMGFPTVFIDGGYEVVFGGKEKSLFEEGISKAESRNVPQIILNVGANWNTNKSELTVTTTIKNKESKTYDGILKVYIAEINSRWSNYEGNPYHFAFIDYAMNVNVEIEPDENKSFSETWTGNYANIYPENLWIVAVVFNSDSISKYSNPPLNSNSFDAHYADAADATRVAEGTLPPSIGISSPKPKNRYIFGKEVHPFIGNTLLKKPVIIGKITIKANVEAEAGVEKVEFTITGLLGESTETVTSEPYEWTWDKFALGRYTITAKVYDKEGGTATDSIDVIALILGGKFI